MQGQVPQQIVQLVFVTQQAQMGLGHGRQQQAAVQIVHALAGRGIGGAGGAGDAAGVSAASTAYGAGGGGAGANTAQAGGANPFNGIDVNSLMFQIVNFAPPPPSSSPVSPRSTTPWVTWTA